MDLTCHGKTDLGRRRQLNEDTLYWSEDLGLCIVADGMGGRDFGEVASSLCVSTLKTTFKKYFPETLRGLRLADGGPLEDVVRHTFDAWIRDMNAAVFDLGALDDKYRDMGTTVALLYHQEDFVAVAHVGDSRVYRIRGDEITQVTEDHSFVNSQLKLNLITPEEAATSAHKNIITRAVGVRGHVQPDVGILPAEPGDLYLLCSDGLSDLVEDEVILRALDDVGRDLHAGVDVLVDLANERGGVDNITVLLARTGAADPATRATPVGAVGGADGDDAV